MSATNSSPASRRTIWQWVFGCGLDQSLVTVWVTEIGKYDQGQTETETKVMLGRYTVLRWSRIYTPATD